jgi:hypothetical protein
MGIFVNVMALLPAKARNPIGPDFYRSGLASGVPRTIFVPRLKVQRGMTDGAAFRFHQ